MHDRRYRIRPWNLADQRYLQLLPPPLRKRQYRLRDANENRRALQLDPPLFAVNYPEEVLPRDKFQSTMKVDAGEGTRSFQNSCELDLVWVRKTSSLVGRLPIRI